MESLETVLEDILRNLKDTLRGIKGIVIATRDGLPVSSALTGSDFQSDADLNTLCAMSAVLDNVSKRVANATFGEGGEIRYSSSILNSIDGTIISCPMDNVCLLALFRSGINIDDTKIKIEEVANDIRKYIIEHAFGI